MQVLIENKNWSIEENENFQSILCLLDLTIDQQQILHNQIQKFKSPEKIINFLLNADPDWDSLQKWIEKENSNQVQEKQQQSIIQEEKQWNQQQLMILKNQLSSQINSNEELNKILQYIQQTNLNKEIVANVLNCEFETFEEFIQLTQIFEGESKIVTRRPPQQNNDKQQSKNILYDNQQIKQLFTEFQSLNGRNNLQIQNLLIQLYSSFQYQQFDPTLIDFQPSPDLEYEDLFILCTKVKQYFSYYPRPVQLLSVIELYNHNNDQGRLAQIYTGEGKTLIVAMLAILLCKKKQINVDIVTSSPVLAIRDVQELTPFYKLFSISVAHNINGSQNQLKKMFPCYNSQVIYGDPHSFQADILRHEYSELGTMGDRKQGYVIVDEVDSMLIDGHSNKTLLSTPIPGMLDLTKVLRLIWDEICKQQPNISTDKKVMVIDQNNFYSVDLEEYIQKTLDIQLQDALYNFIPKFRLNYIDFMKKTWIENAILAMFHYHERKHYLIDNNNVRIIDYQNTGVVHQDNMQWQKGLHQFIQLKHNLPITPLRISTNYLSNVGFFKRYQNQLLGLTGTLGSQVTQNLLSKQYKLDFVLMPPFKQRLLKIEPGIATLSKDEWYQEILKSVQQQVNKGRAVLIINQTIQDVQKIEAYLKKYKIKSTTYVDDQQELKKVIGPQTVIIATNLAGRGTDLTTNEELERNGGLHVIMSFLPRNIRIQLQGFGRTGRQGKLGTAELIVTFPDNLYVGQLTQIKTIQDAINYYQTKQKQQMQNYFEVLVYFRDLNEQYYSDEIELEMEKLLNEDRCFNKFCEIAKKKVNMKENRAAFQSLEEKWGLYLEQYQDIGLNEEDIENWLNSDEGQNPKYLISQGLQKDDLKIFQKAAEIAKTDPQVQYYKGLSEIQSGQYKNGCESLQKAKSLFQIKIDDEKGFATASKLNRIQVEQFQDNQSLIEFQESVIMVPNENLELPDLDLTRDSESHNISAIQFVKQNDVQKDTVERKINNHLKVYNKVINNIDTILNTMSTFNPEEEVLDLSWMPVIMKDEKENVDLEQSIKDQQEVIDDGPLPKLGKIAKKKKEKSWLQYVAMFAIGLCQFVVGCAICAFTGGAAMPIGRALITEGISDMLTAVISAWKGIDIDWGNWGQQKMINIGSALVMAGPAGIKEALHLGGNAMKSLKKIGIAEFLKQIPEITAEGLKKNGFWLTDLDKEVVQNQYNTLKQISSTVSKVGNSSQLLNLAYDVLQNQVSNNVIDKEAATGIFDLINQCFQQSSGVEDFKNNFCQFAKKYIRLQMAQSKQGKSDSQIKEEVTQFSFIEGNKKYQQVKQDIEQYKQYKKAMENELKYFSTIMLDCFSRDQKIQKIVILLDLYYEKLCDFEKIKESITDKLIQSHLSQNFSFQDQTLQNACIQLQISNPQSLNQFYQKVIRPNIYNLCCLLSNQIKYKNPLEVILQKEYQKQIYAKRDQLKIDYENLNNQQQYLRQQQDLINPNQRTQNQIEQLNQMIDDFNNKRDQYQKKQNQLQEIEKLQYHELIINSIAYLKNKGMINDDDLTFKPQFLKQYQKYLENEKFDQAVQEILLSAIKNIPNEINNFQLTSKKIFSNKLKQAIEVAMLDEIKKYIFDTKMQKEDEKITSKIN
ncbi:unnamed protein product [Paramecium pentaurelia]|uniref:Protein translocase subunit SecA n=1 Tax=Paramecium pentaurelia TaxID=43138 RepID=A0A8S1XJ24_9CILI|nr:unnamed protein product [Paramecium pentaurelia]